MEPSQSQASLPPDVVASCRNYTSEEQLRTCTLMDAILEYLNTLKIETEVERLVDALFQLNVSLSDTENLNDSLLVSLEDQRIQEDILICMHNFYSNDQVQKLGCDLLSTLIRLSPEIASDMVNKDIHQRIFRVLRKHQGDLEVQIAALETLKLLAENQIVRRKLLCGEGDIVGHLLTEAHAHPSEPGLLCAVFRALCLIIQDDANVQSDLVRNGEHRTVLSAMESHEKNATLLVDCCRLLHLLTSEATIFVGVFDGIAQLLINDDVHDILAKVIYWNQSNEEILKSALAVLAVLCIEEDVLHKIASVDLETTLHGILIRFMDSSAIQISVFSILDSIFLFDDELTYARPQNMSLDWLKQVYYAMTHHRDDADLQDACCRVLARLMELFPDLSINMGEDPDKGQYPVQSLCFGALLMHETEAHVVISCCHAIYWLSADHEYIQNLLVQKNAFVAICHSMKYHRADPFVQEAGCKALRGLCIFSRKNKEKIAWNIDLDDIFRPLMIHQDLPEVQTESIAIIATLADTELVRSRCMVEDIHQNILQAIETHENVPLLQEVSLEALAILCAADGGAALLNECKAIEKVIASMRIHQYSTAIQRKGIVLLQILIDDFDFSECRDLSSDVISVTTSAMQDHEDVPGVMTEGCVAMLILVEKWPYTAVQLVGNNMHCRLFHILENLKEHQNLLDLADECLYILYSCDTALKSQMLLQASAQGIDRGVECLVQLGAEVNVGTGTDTPLCHASRLGNEHMVALLLQQGVTDLQTPLHLALQAGRHNITGMILAHLGYDQQAGIVSWSDLELGDIRPEWMEPTFLGGLGTSRLVSEYGMSMAQRVRRSEDRRMSRLKRNHSDSSGIDSPRATRRLSLRYSFNSNRSLQSFEEYVQKLEDPDVAEKEFRDDLRNEEPQEGKGPLAFIKRTVQNLKNRRKSSPVITTPVRKLGRKKSDLIKSISATKLALFDKEGYQGDCYDVDVVEFTQCPDELREWKEFTLTGSNVPFSPLDPRRSTGKAIYKQPRAVPGQWRRKSPFSVSRRRSDSMLMFYKKNGTSRSLKSLSQGSLQGDGDDSSNNSLLGSNPSISDCGLGNAWSPRHRSSGRKRAVTMKASFPTSRDDSIRSLTTIRDEGTSQSAKNTSSPSATRGMPSTLSTPYISPAELTDHDEGEDDVFAMATSGSELPHLATIASAPMGSRRCRSATFGDLASTETPGRHVIHVDISNNKIHKMDKLLDGTEILLDRFGLLEKIDLSQNVLEKIPDQLFKLFRNVQHLNIAQNQLREMPTTALNCRHLTNINLSRNRIEHIDFLGNGISMSITELNLSHNGLTVFPKGLAKTIPQLESLSLNGNNISELPSEPLILRNLRSLDLAHNDIQCIPDLLLTQTPALESLDLTGNEIETLPSEEVALVLPKLAVVKLGQNNIATKEPFYIPKFLLELESLRSITLDENQLTALPQPTLWKATGLREIFASCNEIKKLNLGSQPRLWATVERLSLSHNRLAELTKDIGQLTSLTSLDISYNEKLTSIPDEMGRLQKLWEFPLDGLKLDLDEALVKGRTKDLIGYLHEKLKRSVEYYHMKMMVVGYGGRGKSTLLRALRRQKQLEKSIPTVGVVVRDWKFRGRGRRPGLGTVTYTLSTWDFAGQEEFYATHQCFLSNRALYLVVYNLAKGRSELEMLRPWLVNIQARAPNCPVIVVGTHLDKVPKDQREAAVNAMRQRITEMCECPGYPDLKGLTEVSSTQEGQAMERLRVLVKDVLDNFKIKGQPAMGEKIPESYVRLQELLSAEARNLRTSIPIIRRPRLIKIARDAGLAFDEGELHQAIRFLHEAGSLLHYDDAALQLNSFYFIDPEWLCRMMAQVVTVREINPFITPQGFLKREHVRHLFTGKRVGMDVPYTFPAYLIPQYLMLLEKFQIALPHNKDEFLIPSRLPVQRPAFRNPLPLFDDRPVNQRQNEGQNSAPNYIERRCELSYTPIGFWARLITRLLVFTSTLLQELDLGRKGPVETQYWREGIYVYYAQNAYFLVASDNLEGKAISVTVPATRPGSRLLGELVDHIDALIEEWYPGLQEVSPTGEQLVKRKIPCPICNDYVFELEELISQSDLNDSTECPAHKGVVPLTLLAPDIVLGDMEEKYRLDMDKLVFVQSPEHILGDGTFGCVYRAKYKDQFVAVKLFNSLGEGHPYKLMRQEAGILRRLHHPSLICMLGVGLHPRVLLLELAPVGALGTLLKSKRVISRSLQQRIATQVADGLTFIHELNIIYRDMKPDNILIFSLSLASVINAKISDYGISRLATACGLTQPEGTPGYRSPEVIRGESYSFQADIYSFGVTMYELVTEGQHPFSDLNFRSEIDDAILKGRRVEPITKKGANPWPDMEDVIDNCLQPIPEHRPTSSKLLENLRHVDFLNLRRTVAVSKGVSVECMAIRGYGESDLEVWVASGDKDNAQLTWLNLTSHAQEPKGLLQQGSRILSITSVGQSSMLLGTQAGTICVYDAWQHKCKHVLPPLEDSVLCLQNYSGYQDRDYIFAGLANGRLAVYHTNNVLTRATARPEYLQIATEREPIIVMRLDHKSKRLYLGAGANVHVVRVGEPHLDIEGSFNTNRSGQTTELIAELIISGKHAHIAKKGQSIIEMWHLTKHKLLKQKDIAPSIHDSLPSPPNNTNKTDARVTSMILVTGSTLWLGTGGGAIVLVDSATYEPLVALNRYASSVRCLAWARVFDQCSMVLSGGLGMNYYSSNSEHQADSDHGYLFIWDTDIPQQLKALKDYDKRRQEWVDLNRPETEKNAVEKTTTVQTEHENMSTKPTGKEAAKTTNRFWRRISEDMLSKSQKNTPQRNAQLVDHKQGRRQSYQQRNARKSFPASGAPTPGSKRSSLTPNLEYGRSKSIQHHPLEGTGSKQKRRSIQVLSQEYRSQNKGNAGGNTMEIGQLLETRRRSSGALKRHSIGRSVSENLHTTLVPPLGIPIPDSPMGGEGSPTRQHRHHLLSDLEEGKITDHSDNDRANPSPVNSLSQYRASPGRAKFTIGGSPGSSYSGGSYIRSSGRRTRKNSKGRTRRDSSGEGTGQRKHNHSESSTF